MNDTPSLIEAVDVKRTYAIARHEVPVLHAASVAVPTGKSVAVVGVSGAGKSTLLHVMGGLDRPDGGHIKWSGTDIYDLTEGQRTARRAREIGFVFQSYHLLPELDVVQNVMLPAMALSGFNERRARRRALELLRTVGMPDRAVHRPMELSGGEQQRVALARALMNEPPIILADEPTGNLDEDTGAGVLDALFALVATGNHALLLVTHSRSTAARCDRVLELRDGFLTSSAGD